MTTINRFVAQHNEEMELLNMTFEQELAANGTQMSNSLH